MKKKGLELPQQAENYPELVEGEEPVAPKKRGRPRKSAM